MTGRVSISISGPARRALSTAERQAAHLIALAAPMVGIPLRGDPTIIGKSKTPSPEEWERCLYATAILRQRDPNFAGDLSLLEASLDLFNTVVFRARVRCRRDPAHPTGSKWVVVATVELAADATSSPTLLRSGDRAGSPALPPPSQPATTAGQTERTSP